MLIGIEYDINTIWHIIRIYCHAFKIMGSVNHDSNLGIMRIAKRNIFYSSSKLNDPILIDTAIFSLSLIHISSIMDITASCINARPV